MNILVVYAHPKKDSFNHATLEAFVKGAKAAKHKVDVIDLYEDQFNPVLMETSPRAELGEEVVAYQERIKQADWLCFIYPTFWYRTPAMLAGFIDRVFTSRFAYRYVKFIGSLKRPIGLLPLKKAVVIESYGGPGWFYKLVFLQMPWRRFKRVLKFCGIRKFIHHPNFYVPFGSDEMRKKYLKSVEKIGRRLN